MAHTLELKKKIYDHCLALVNEKLENLHQAFAESREALQSEAKSTAGDKHQTGRAMIQLEQEKMSRQLQETEKLKNMLQRVPYDKAFDSVQSGALVETSNGHFFVAVGLSQVKIDDQEIFVLAPSSPLAQAMLGKKAGEKFQFRGSEMQIQSLL